MGEGVKGHFNDKYIFCLFYTCVWGRGEPGVRPDEALLHRPHPQGEGHHHGPQEQVSRTNMCMTYVIYVLVWIFPWWKIKMGINKYYDSEKLRKEKTQLKKFPIYRYHAIMFVFFKLLDGGWLGWVRSYNRHKRHWQTILLLGRKADRFPAGTGALPMMEQLELGTIYKTVSLKTRTNDELGNRLWRVNK